MSVRAGQLIDRAINATTHFRIRLKDSSEAPERRPAEPSADRVRDLVAPLRLEVRQLLEPAGVIEPVMRPAQRAIPNNIGKRLLRSPATPDSRRQLGEHGDEQPGAYARLS